MDELSELHKNSFFPEAWKLASDSYQRDTQAFAVCVGKAFTNLSRTNEPEDFNGRVKVSKALFKIANKPRWVREIAGMSFLSDGISEK